MDTSTVTSPVPSPVPSSTLDGVESGFKAEGIGASVAFTYGAAEWFSKADAGWIGRGSEPQGVCREVTGVFKSPVDMLENGRFLGSPPTLD
jgi:hypothetical protein